VHLNTYISLYTVKHLHSKEFWKILHWKFSVLKKSTKYSIEVTYGGICSALKKGVI
jgi:hypothetical protein